LNKWGRWNDAEYVELPEIIRLQQAVREALTDSPDKWFASQYSLPFNWRRSPKFPYFALLTDKVEVAVRMTVTIDLLNQSRFQTCERRDCGRPFKVESGHNRKFCSRHCGHLEAVRRSRKTSRRERVS